MFATNGEVKDVSRQRYCQARWQEGINLFSAMMDQEVDEEKPKGGKRV
jgi:hypothetical protein